MKCRVPSVIAAPGATGVLDPSQRPYVDMSVEQICELLGPAAEYTMQWIRNELRQEATDLMVSLGEYHPEAADGFADQWLEFLQAPRWKHLLPLVLATEAN